jgi:signal peptidase II
MNQTERSFRCLLWTLALVGLSVDQASKYGVFRWLYNNGEGDRVQIVPGAFELLAQFSDERVPADGLWGTLRTWSGENQPKVNHGALFGLGGQYIYLANGAFAGVSVLAAVAIIWWSSRSGTRHDWALCAALGMILAGTLGNLYDRMIFGGVRDFLHFYWIEWPVFNVADCCLVCGASLLLIQAFWAQPVPSTTLLQPEVVEAN